MSNYVIPGETLTDIADAIRLKRDIATEITPEDMALQVSLIEGGGAPQELSVNISTYGIVTINNKIAMGTINDFDPDAIYHVVIKYNDSYAAATSSSPVAVWISLLARWGSPVAGRYKQMAITLRAIGDSSFANNFAPENNAFALDASGTLYLYSPSSNVYTTLGIGTYTATIYKL